MKSLITFDEPAGGSDVVSGFGDFGGGDFGGGQSGFGDFSSGGGQGPAATRPTFAPIVLPTVWAGADASGSSSRVESLGIPESLLPKFATAISESIRGLINLRDILAPARRDFEELTEAMQPLIEAARDAYRGGNSASASPAGGSNNAGAGLNMPVTFNAAPVDLSTGATQVVSRLLPEMHRRFDDAQREFATQLVAARLFDGLAVG